MHGTRPVDNKARAWRSLVARTVRVGEVPGSNPGAATTPPEAVFRAA